MSKLNNISVDGTVYNIDDFHVIKNNSYNNPFIITEHEPGIYIVDSSEANYLPGKLYAKYIDSEDYNVRTEYYDGFLCLTDTSIDDPYTYKNIGYIFDASAGLAHPCVTQPAPWGFSLTGASSGIGNSAVKTIGNQTIYGKKVFSTLPESSVVPTTNNQLVNKKYVDEVGVKVGTSVYNNYRTNIIKGKNLFNINDITPNNFLVSDTGNISSSTSWSTSNYIEVNSSTSYVLNYVRSGASNTTICFYNNSKAFISSASTSTLGLPATFTTPNNAKYLRFDYKSADNQTNIQLEKGSTATTYEPFIVKNIVVDNEKFTETIGVGSSINSANRVNILFQGGNILPKGTIHNLTSGSVALNFKVPKANTQYTMKSNIPAGEGAVVFFGSGADATVTTSNNGVSSTTPRTMTSDSNGYVTIAFRYLSEAGSQRNLDLYWYTIVEGTTGEDYVPPSINVDGETIYTKGQNEEYSNAETVIGAWIDGKPLYRKVFTITSLTSSNTNLVDVSGLSIDFAKISGTIITTSGEKFPINLYDSASNYSVIFLSGPGYIRGRGVIGAGSLAACIVILEYTKTTDA